MAKRAEEERRIKDRIRQLTQRLDSWKRTPMQKAVQEIGALAIRQELSKTAEPLRQEW